MSIGYHFFCEGLEKYENPSWTSASFLWNAKGPWADEFHALAAADQHGWSELMEVAERKTELSPGEKEQRERFAREARELDEKVAQGEQPELKVPPFAPYAAYVQRVREDWSAMTKLYIQQVELTEDQQSELSRLLYRREKQLLDYFYGLLEEIEDHRHELARLEQLESSEATGDLPFHDQRVVEKKAELAAEARRWRATVRQFEEGLLEDLRTQIELSDRQGALAASFEHPSQLREIDRGVMWLTLGVGVCLLVGLLTRLASLAGALFLLSVIATQPPWIPEAADVYKETVEMFALLTLATTPVGRWGGLDFFIHWIFTGCCRSKGAAS